MSDFTTAHGFGWGPMTVTRVATVENGRRSSHVLGIRTEREEVEVYVTRTGMIRVFRKGKRQGEMKVQS